MTTASITCPRCGRTSHHPDDVRNQFCANCDQYFDLMECPLCATPLLRRQPREGLTNGHHNFCLLQSVYGHHVGACRCRKSLDLLSDRELAIEAERRLHDEQRQIDEQERLFQDFHAAEVTRRASESASERTGEVPGFRNPPR